MTGHTPFSELKHKTLLTDGRKPLCACHEEPMHRNGFTSQGAQKWRCAVKNARTPVERRTEYEENAYFTRRRRDLRKLRDTYLSKLTELQEAERRLENVV